MNTPNATTRAAIAASERGEVTRFDSVEAMFAELEESSMKASDIKVGDQFRHRAEGFTITIKEIDGTLIKYDQEGRVDPIPLQRTVESILNHFEPVAAGKAAPRRRKRRARAA